MGVLGTTASAVWSQWDAAFVRRLRELGWIEGRTVAIEYRWAEGRNERYREIAAVEDYGGKTAGKKVEVLLFVIARNSSLRDSSLRKWVTTHRNFYGNENLAKSSPF